MRKSSKAKTRKNKNDKKPLKKYKLGKCFYHLCEKKNVRLCKCKYCDNYFCEEHKNPKIAGVPNFKSTRLEDMLFLANRNKPGHPCFPYTIYLEENHKKEVDEEWERILRESKKNKGRTLPKQTISKNIPNTKAWKDWYNKRNKIPSNKEAFEPLEVDSLEKPDIVDQIKSVSSVKKSKSYKNTKKKRFTINKSFVIFLILVLLAIVALYAIDTGVIPIINFSVKCEDGTFYNQCSENQPYYCIDGELVEKADYCGCPDGYMINGKSCLSYEYNPKTVKFHYLSGSYVNYTLYEGVNIYLSGLPRSISYYENEPAPTAKDFLLRELDNEVQMEYLLPLVEEIRKESDNKNEQVRIAARLVQRIPYDWDAFNSKTIVGFSKSRYPYQVLYEEKGLCGEKAGLLLFILRELGYEVVAFDFGEIHRAVGIKCPQGNYDTDYCFIEPTTYFGIGKIPAEYVGGVNIRGMTPTVIKVSDGKTYVP